MIKPHTSSTSTCPDCGAPVNGGAAGCEAIFHELIARDFGDYRYFAVHRLAVDAYALQHPDWYGRSAKSLAAHLTGVCVGVEHAGDPELNRAVQRWLSGNPPLTRPEPPPFRGSITVVDVMGDTGPEEHARRVQGWAESAWEAYAGLHGVARAWIREALEAEDLNK